LHVTPVAEFEQEIVNWELDTTQKKNILINYQQGNEELSQFFAQQSMDDKTFEFVTTVSTQLQQIFRRDIKEMLVLMQSIKSDTVATGAVVNANGNFSSSSSTVPVPPGFSNAIRQMLKATATNLVSGVKHAFWSSVDVISYILKNPHSARILALCSLMMKRKLCRQISIKLGFFEYRKAKTTWEKASEYVGNSVTLLTEMIPEVTQTFLNGPRFTEMMASIKSYSGAPFKAFLSCIPFVGGVSGFFFDFIFDVMAESAREALEISLFTESVTKTGSYVIELLDITNCIQHQIVDEDESLISGSGRQTKKKSKKKSKKRSKKHKSKATTKRKPRQRGKPSPLNPLLRRV